MQIMFFTRQGGGNAANVLNWNKPGDSSLTSGLLDDVVPPEIELSNYYGGAPSPGSESPSGLLYGESLKVEPIADLDLFFERLYSYYCEKGLWCIVVKWIVELLSLGFTICFSGFFLLYVDWGGLRNAKCGIDAVESRVKPCDLAKEALHQHPLTPLTISKVVILGYLGVFSVYWVFCFFRFFTQLKETLRIRHFYYNRLHISDCELKTIPWPSVLEKVVYVQNTQQLCVVKDLSVHDILMRLMRKENYLIAMINKGVLAFPISKWVPGAGPTVKSGANRSRQRLILTKTLEWTLNWSILQSMFDRNFCLRRDFLSNPDILKKRLAVMGFTMFLLSPFLVIFMLVYLFLRHAEQFYNHPTTASSRRWSNLSRWMFREFNEVEHFFRHRIDSSVIHASDYLKQFPSPIISMVAKFISFVAGGFAAVLIIIAFLDESLLEGHILGRNLFWYAAVFGTITAISRAAVSDELLVLDHETRMSSVVHHTHYMPKRWRGKENTDLVRLEFATLFQYTGMMWLEEMASIFLTPYLLIFVVPKRVDDIVQFITEFTVNIEGVGDVCSFSAFDFRRHGNANYAAPCNSLRSHRSSQGKMEKSFLSFVSSYPTWQPDAQGMQFLNTLKTFRDQKFQELKELNLNPYLRQYHAEHNYHFSTGAPYCNSPQPGCHLGSLWLVQTDPRPHPYLLDWFYISGPHKITGGSHQIPDDSVNANSPAVAVDIDNDHDDPRGESWPGVYERQSCSHLKASRSTPLEHSILQHESSKAIRSTDSIWWARGGPAGGAQLASFLEPPNYGPHAGPTVYSHSGGSDFYDAHSERSVEEQEKLDHLDWRNYHELSRTTYPGEEEFSNVGELKLHFDDIFGPSQPNNPDHADFD